MATFYYYDGAAWQTGTLYAENTGFTAYPAYYYDGTSWVQFQGSSTGSGGSGASLTIDDFEHNDLATYYDDATGFSTTTGAARSGSYGLKLEDVFGGHMFSIPGGSKNSDLDNYPSRGDSFEFYIRPDWYGNDPIARVQWCVQSYSYEDAYRIDITPDSQDFRKMVGGSHTSLLTFFETMSTGTWYRFEVDFGDATSSDITIIIEESGTTLDQQTATDTTWDSGGIGFWSSEHGIHSIDDYQLL